MILKVEYQDIDERESLINTHSHMFLIEEQNITEGNFLVFSNEPLPEKVIYTEVPEEELESSKQRITDLELTIADIITLL